MVAGFSPDQLAAFNTVQNSQGIAQPYIDQASGFAAQGAAPVANLSAADIQKYYNPYQSMVIDATKANINETNAQQQQQLIGNSALQGAWGGDRVGVAQAELARQQNLSNNQTLANLSAQGFSQAANLGNQQLVNQQQNAGRAGQAAYTFGSLGNEAQNTTLQGANAQLGTGGLQQQLSQANLNWPYQQYLQQQAFPYQQTGWLASVAGGLGSNAGGTSTTTGPSPNPWNQFLGLGAAAAGAYGASGGFSGQNASNWNSSLPNGSFDGSGAFAEGGAVDGEFDNLSLPNIPDAGSSFIPSVNIPHGSGPPKPQQSQGSGQQSGGSGGPSAGDVASTAMKFLPLFLGDGGRVVAGFADGGMPQMPFGGQQGFIPQAQAMRGAGPPRPPAPLAMPPGNDNLGNMLQSAASAAGHLRGAVKPDQPQGFAEGGMPDDGSLNPRNWMGFETNGVGGTFPPMQDAQPPAAPSIVPDEMPPEITQGASASTFGGGEADPTDTVSGALPFSSEPAPGLGSPQATDLNPNGGVAQTQERQPQAPNPWWGLVQAGLATAASKSPFLGQAIGEGGLAGMKEYEGQQKHELEDRKVISDETYKKAHAKYLADQAFKVQKQLDISQQNADTNAGYRADTAAERTRSNKEKEDIKREELAQKKVAADAGIIDDETSKFTAQQAAAGDYRALQNYGRGAQGAQNLNKVRKDLRQIYEAQGLSGADLAAKMASYSSLAAGARTAAIRSSNIESAIEEAKATFPLGIEASKAVPRTDFVPYNRAVQMVERGTSSPELAKFVTANQGIITAYSQAMSRTGINTVHAQQSAEALLSTATSQEAYAAVLSQMEKEMQAAQVAPDIVRKHILDRIAGKAAPASGVITPPPAATEPAPAAPGKRVRQNGIEFEQMPDGSYKPVKKAD